MAAQAAIAAVLRASKADAGRTMTEIVSAEQSVGIGQINSSVSELDQMTQQNAALVEQSAAPPNRSRTRPPSWPVSSPRSSSNRARRPGADLASTPDQGSLFKRTSHTQEPQLQARVRPACNLRISANVTGDFVNVTDFDSMLGCAQRSGE